MTIKNFLSYVVGPAVVGYCVTAFIAWQPNVAQWTEAGRSYALFFAAAAAWGVFSIRFLKGRK